jgi:hypothetical protein
MNEIEATEEAIRMFIRKTRRLHPEAFADVMGKLSEGARWALDGAENRADSRFMKGEVDITAYPMPEDDEDDEN